MQRRGFFDRLLPSGLRPSPCARLQPWFNLTDVDRPWSALVQTDVEGPFCVRCIEMRWTHPHAAIETEKVVRDIYLLADDLADPRQRAPLQFRKWRMVVDHEATEHPRLM
jgi:hypothetical protein